MFEPPIEDQFQASRVWGFWATTSFANTSLVASFLLVASLQVSCNWPVASKSQLGFCASTSCKLVGTGQLQASFRN